MRSNSFLSSLLLFASLSTAWPGSSPERNHMNIAQRQDSSQSQNSGSSQSGPKTYFTATSASGSQSQSNTNGASSSASRITSGITSGITASGASNSTKTTAIDPRLPPGGVSMITPAATDGVTYVKVGNEVTFVWNYTSLSVPPSYIDVVATNTVNSQSYTVAGNMSYDPTQTVVWDTGEWASGTGVPFVVATYTLMVYDAASEPTAVAKAGYLGAYNQLTFGVYTPQPYTPLNEFKCATCSGAMSLHEKQAIMVLLGTAGLTFVGFTWFVSGLGLF